MEKKQKAVKQSLFRLTEQNKKWLKQESAFFEMSQTEFLNKLLEEIRDSTPPVQGDVH